MPLIGWHCASAQCRYEFKNLWGIRAFYQPYDIRFIWGQKWFYYKFHGWITRFGALPFDPRKINKKESTLGNKIGAVHGVKGSGFSAASDRRSGQFDRKRDSSVAESHTRGSKFNTNLNRWYVNPELWLRLWGEKANSWHSRLIHTQNGGIIRLIVPPKLIYSIRFHQKRNVEPLNPEPVNAYKNRFQVTQQIMNQSKACVVIIDKKQIKSIVFEDSTDM